MNPQCNVNVSLCSETIDKLTVEAASQGAVLSENTEIAYIKSFMTHCTLFTINPEADKVNAVADLCMNYMQQYKFKRQDYITIEKVFVVNGFEQKDDMTKKPASRKFVGNIDALPDLKDTGLHPPYTVFTWLMMDAKSYEKQGNKIREDFKMEFGKQFDDRFPLSLHSTAATYWKFRQGEYLKGGKIYNENNEAVLNYQNPTQKDLDDIIKIHNGIELNVVGKVAFESVKISKRNEQGFQPAVVVNI